MAHKSIGQRGYYFLDPRVFNKLPSEIKNIRSFNLLKKKNEVWTLEQPRIRVHNLINVKNHQTDIGNVNHFMLGMAKFFVLRCSIGDEIFCFLFNQTAVDFVQIGFLEVGFGLFFFSSIMLILIVIQLGNVEYEKNKRYYNCYHYYCILISRIIWEFWPHINI